MCSYAYIIGGEEAYGGTRKNTRSGKDVEGGN